MREIKNRTIATWVLFTLPLHVAMAQSLDMQAPRPPEPKAFDEQLIPRPSSNAIPTVPSGGRSVEIRTIEIEGNRSLSTDELLRHLESPVGKRYDLAGLKNLAQEIQLTYRSSGYPFAQAILPPQDLSAGTLHIRIIEGQYGKIGAVGPDSLTKGADPFLQRNLKSGDSIENQKLERTLLILDDQPGMKVQPVIRPGTSQGEADLQVRVARSDYWSGDAGLDNTGAPSTGIYRARSSLRADSPFRYGDQVAVDAMVTDLGMWFGSLSYETPLGTSGLRGKISYAHTSYQLGGSFSSLNAHGVADVSGLTLTYPIIRSQATNILGSFGFQHQDLEDDYDSTNQKNTKSIDGVPLSVQFDNRDTVLGGGVTYGSASILMGQLNLGSSTVASDAATAQTQGSFTKINIDLARIQHIVGDTSAYGRFSGQWADKNLDSSQKFNLGGFYGVRSFSLGDGVGDTGWFTQLELRHQVGITTPFIFYDFGQSTSNVKPWDTTSSSSRTVAGTGLGTRVIYEKWTLDLTAAWQTQGGPSTADPANPNPRYFFMAGRKF